MNANSFPCAECGRPVVLMTGSGRTREYVRGCRLPIPNDFQIPTCTGCGEVYMTEELSAKLDPLLRKQFLLLQSAHYRQLVSILIRRHGVTQRDVVRTCQVTPSYLSHVLSGKKQASATLTRLLEAFVACPSEFRRHLADLPWADPTTKPVKPRKAQTEAVVWASDDNVVEIAGHPRWSPQHNESTPANSNSLEAGAA